MTKNKLDNKSVQLQTKVTPEAYARLASISKKYGFSIFQLLRMLAECIIRYMDDQHNLSEELQRIMRLFDNIQEWEDSICLAGDIEQVEVVEAFCVIKDKHKKGARLIYVEKPMFNGNNEWQTTYNIQRIVERFIEVANPSLYRLLRQLAADLGTESMLDTIHTIANLYKENPDEKELRLQFESNDWHRNAQMHDRGRYKRGRNNSDDYNGQISLKL